MTSGNPLVSIVTPTYNHERYIGACIESVLSQTYTNWEMIIVDDGSTDHTWNIVQQYASIENRIHPFKQENRGIYRLAETYNFALSKSVGEVIAILEGDDIWISSKLSHQVPCHLSGNYSVSFGMINYINCDGIIISKRPYPDSRIHSKLFNKPDPKEYVISLMRSDFFIPALTVLVNRSVLVKTSGFIQPPYLPLLDYPTWISLGIREDRFGFIPEILGYYRTHQDQATWRLARQIAVGEYRFVREVLHTQPEFLNIPKDKIEKWLLSKGRRNFLASSSYRAAAVAFEDGAYWDAIHYTTEVIKYGQWMLFIQCCMMLGIKLARKIYKSIITTALV